MTLLDTIRDDIGQAEIRGKRSNPFILRIINWLLPNEKDDSEVAWCAIYIAYKLYKLNVIDLKFINKHGAKLASTRYWIQLLEQREGDPRIGDIAILWRESIESWKGHITVISDWNLNDKYFIGTGGNQRNRVGSDLFNKDRVLKICKPELIHSA